MLLSLNRLEKCSVAALDGDAGRVHDFLFDDSTWSIHHMVVNTGGMWLGAVEVLISPADFRQIDQKSRRFGLALTSEKVRKSPGIYTHKPVAMQDDRNYHRHFEWSNLWLNDASMPAYVAAYPWAVAGPPNKTEPESNDDPHLRSARQVLGYHVRAADRGVGHVGDYIVDDENWDIHYVVVDTHWWFSKRLLVPVNFIERIRWIDATVYVGPAPEVIQKCPPWDGQPIDRKFERRLHDYYARAGYVEKRGISGVRESESRTS